MNTYTLNDFDLEQIALSGQCFRMDKTDDGYWLIVAGEHCTRISQNGNQVSFSCSQTDFNAFWHNYFDLNTDYRTIREQIDPSDTHLSLAAQKGWGIRILRQDLWEMIITFLISQNNNIPRIKNSLNTLCTQAGKQLTTDEGISYYSFPCPQSLAEISLSQYRSMGLGYRDKYIKKVSEEISLGNFDLEQIKQLPYPEAKKELTSLFGVGNKVADCICLFGLHHTDAFPTDTHIRQILSLHYPKGFPFNRYPGTAGIMQQYLFYDKLHQ